MLDEPRRRLDTSVRENLQGTIRVTHDLGAAITLADRIGILRQGHLVGCDAPMRLFERPAAEATAFNAVEGLIQSLSDRGEFVENTCHGDGALPPHSLL